MADQKREVYLQRQYYEETAKEYDSCHLSVDQEHELGLHLLKAYISFYEIKTVLDVGTGTGRALTWLKENCPELALVKGVEPVKALRQEGYRKGLSEHELIEGDAYNLPFKDNSFDLVTEFATLHHVRHPQKMIHEMSRVSKKMISISDCNFMAQGAFPLRSFKYFLFSLSLWPIANLIKTKGKGYTFSEGDGITYSYSVFQNMKMLKKKWHALRILTTKGESDSWSNQMLSAEQLLIIAFDKKQ